MKIDSITLKLEAAPWSRNHVLELRITVYVNGIPTYNVARHLPQSDMEANFDTYIKELAAELKDFIKTKPLPPT